MTHHGAKDHPVHVVAMTIQEVTDRTVHAVVMTIQEVTDRSNHAVMALQAEKDPSRHVAMTHQGATDHTVHAAAMTIQEVTDRSNHAAMTTQEVTDRSNHIVVMTLQEMADLSNHAITIVNQVEKKEAILPANGVKAITAALTTVQKNYLEAVMTGNNLIQDTAQEQEENPIPTGLRILNKKKDTEITGVKQSIKKPLKEQTTD
jgi:hypothetical protein